MRVLLIGAGRAGTALRGALTSVGHDVDLVHHDDVLTPDGYDLVVLCVPDDALATMAAALPTGDFVVAHVAGSRGARVLVPHQRTATMHPLAVLSEPTSGAARLMGATWAVSGDPLVRELLRSLDARVIDVADGDRAAYHATATVAANHLTALLAHVDELARTAGLSVDDFIGLARQALEEVAAKGPAAALTGPAARGDLATIDAHLAAIPESERPLYVALSQRAFELAESRARAIR
jgi:predicted short-subunit dehydrogenase-like oxidoreductase (DUF2520 family)